jgi:tRNA pseudouridine55 synthase
VTIYAFDLVGVEDDRVAVRVHCSAGFYVRSLAHDLGQRLGTGAHLAALRRTRSGDSTIEDAIPLDQIEHDPESARRNVIPPARVLPALSAVVLTEEGVRRAVHGRDLRAADAVAVAGSEEVWPDAGSTMFRLLDRHGSLVGIAETSGPPGLLHPRVVLM